MSVCFSSEILHINQSIQYNDENNNNKGYPMKTTLNISIKGIISSMVIIYTTIIIFTALIGLYSINYGVTSLEAVSEVIIKQKTTLNIANTKLLELRSLIQESYINSQKSLKIPDLTDVNKKLADTQAVFESFMKMDIPDRHMPYVRTVQVNVNEYLNEALIPQITSIQKGDLDGFISLIPKETSLKDKYYDSAVVYFVTTEKEGTGLFLKFNSVSSLLLMAMGFMIISSFVLMACAAFAIKKYVLEPLKSAREYCGKLASNDFTQEPQYEGRSEVGQLLESLGSMTAGIYTAVSASVGAGHGVFSQYQAINELTHEISARTEQESAAIVEIAASMNQITATVSNNADNSRNANELAHDASAKAEQGKELMVDAVDQINKIVSDFKQVMSIIEVIESIAFQTNNLALNASVEAARAGESGKAFAVVANEVRALSGKAAESSGRIRDVLKESENGIKSGSVMMLRAGEAMEQILESVRSVSVIISEIASASNEQSVGVTQVGLAITEIDQVVQQNTQTTQRAANAAKRLEAEANKLMSSFAAFKLD